MNHQERETTTKQINSKFRLSMTFKFEGYMDRKKSTYSRFICTYSLKSIGQSRLPPIQEVSPARHQCYFRHLWNLLWCLLWKQSLVLPKCLLSAKNPVSLSMRSETKRYRRWTGLLELVTTNWKVLKLV